MNWSDFQVIGEAISAVPASPIAVTIFGKGHKIRTLLITHQLYSELKQLPLSEKSSAVFLSRFGNRLNRHAIHRLIKKAVETSGINLHTSAHWLRHAHACHSLNNGAGIE